MFNKVFVENSLRDHPRTQSLLDKLRYQSVQYISDYRDVFQKVKKPYLQKRNNLNLFLAEKSGQRVKLAPDAYGQAGEPHYYFVHAYNCIYECKYCYLQGYFHSPDLVWFLNHEDIINDMEAIIRDHPSEQGLWFHAGEFSDSLALAHLTGEIPLYWEFFGKYPQAKLELRTKSVNIKPILELPPLDNIITSFSLSPQDITKKIDLKTPSLTHRLKALARLVEKGHKIALHLDPIIYTPTVLEDYTEMASQICDAISVNQVEYISIGVVRFTKDVYHQVEKNYPESIIHNGDFITSFDNKIRYPRPMRQWLLSHIEQILLNKGFPKTSIYQCME